MGASMSGLGDTIVDAEAIRRRIGELAAAIDAHYTGADGPVVVLCVLSGALIFTADLVRRLTVPVEIAFVTMRSYGDATHSSGRPELTTDVAAQLRDRDVLIVEDIVDTGHTVAALRDHLAELGAHSVHLVALLDKTSRRARPVRVDWSGFDIPDRFVVGYGLDHGGRYRNLPDVRVLDSA
jgi:hypoxanthine phosphoribosyltransferase